MGLFSLDGAFVKYMSLVADIIMLSALFTVMSIPIITIGPSTTALYYVMTKRIYDKESYIFREFFSSFKQNFFQSFLTQLFLSVLIGILSFNVFMLLTGMLNFSSAVSMALGVIYLLLLIEFIIVSVYVFPIIARFRLGFFEAIKVSFFVGNKHMPTTISVGCILFLVTYFTIANPFLLICPL